MSDTTPIPTEAGGQAQQQSSTHKGILKRHYTRSGRAVKPPPKKKTKKNSGVGVPAENNVAEVAVDQDPTPGPSPAVPPLYAVLPSAVRPSLPAATILRDPSRNAANTPTPLVQTSAPAVVNLGEERDDPCIPCISQMAKDPAHRCRDQTGAGYVCAHCARTKHSTSCVKCPDTRAAQDAVRVLVVAARTGFPAPNTPAYEKLGTAAMREVKKAKKDAKVAATGNGPVPFAGTAPTRGELERFFSNVGRIADALEKIAARTDAS